MLLKRVEITGAVGKAALASWYHGGHPLITSRMLNWLICFGKWKKNSSSSGKKFGVIIPGSWIEPLGSVSVACPLNWIPAHTAVHQLLEKGQHLD